MWMLGLSRAPLAQAVPSCFNPVTFQYATRGQVRHNHQLARSGGAVQESLASTVPGVELPRTGDLCSCLHPKGLARLQCGAGSLREPCFGMDLVCFDLPCERGGLGSFESPEPRNVEQSLRNRQRVETARDGALVSIWCHQWLYIS